LAGWYQDGLDPGQDLTIAGEFIYSRLNPKATGTFLNGGALSGGPINGVYSIGGQNIYNGGFNITRSF